MMKALNVLGLAGGMLLAQGTPAPVARLVPQGEWVLRGGLLTAGLVPPPARAAWPGWMRALCGKGPDPGAKELAKAEFLKIPDAFLPEAANRLRKAKVFTPRLLAQVSAIGFTADVTPWVRARTAYQVAYLAHHELPTADPDTCGRVLTQLLMEGEGPAARAAFQASTFPGEGKLRASYERMMDLQTRREAPTEAMVRDAQRPEAERYLAWRLASEALRRSWLPHLKGTGFFDIAVHHAVTQGELDLGAPLVDEALRGAQPRSDTGPWLLVRPGERASDLLWMRATKALGAGRRDVARDLAQDLLNRFPHSYYAGHGAYLLRGLGLKVESTHLRVPGDLSLGKALDLAPGFSALGEPWPEPFGALAKAGRFDLILAQVDPGKQPVIFLRAAHGAGQLDLVARHFTQARDLSPRTLPLLYPTLPAVTVKRLLKEERAENLMDAAFVLAILKNESQFQPMATSGAKAMGLMQLLRPTFRAMVGRKADIRDPETNLRAGIRYLKRVAQAAQVQGEPTLVRLATLIAGYHAGEGRAKRWQAEAKTRWGSREDPLAMVLRIEAMTFHTTRQYVWRVLGDRELFLRVV